MTATTVATTAGERQELPRLRWRNYLYAKLAVVFFALLAISLVVQYLLSAYLWIDFRNETLQRTQLELAGEVVNEVHELLTPQLFEWPLQEKLDSLQRLNPNVEIYVLDQSGRILYSTVHWQLIRRGTVNLQPLKALLRDTLPTLPLYADDPASTLGVVAFSVAATRIGTGSGYLYVTLGSGDETSLRAAISESYLLLSGLLGSILVLVLSSLLGLAVFFLLTKGLRSLSSSIRQFREGRLGVRSQVVTTDEIGELAASFNLMADTIQRQIAELEKNDELRRGLISNISHDLRGPVSAIKAAAETLPEKVRAGDEAAVEKLVRILGSSARYQSTIIEDLFDLSNLEAKEKRPTIAPFWADELIEVVCDRLTDLSQLRKVSLDVELPGSIPRVLGDERLVERALSNLIENAIRYTQAGGGVTVRAVCHGSKVLFEVLDTGIGIEPAELLQIFESFYRSPSGREKEASGTGLGLAIVRRILELHGSRIEVESTVGKGTRFYFLLEAADTLEQSAG